MSGKVYNGEKAIISLTSWKARINTVAKTLYSLYTQCPGFHIVLVLSEEEFPKKEAELPETLMLFVENELIELLWVYKNYKSFKKVLFTMDKYRDVPIISADDDCIYTCNYAQELYDKWSENKGCIITNDGMPYDIYKLPWGRGPNTLYPLKFSENIEDILKILSKIDTFGDDDCFYGIFAQKMHIPYIDLHKPSYYVFHDTIEPLHERLHSLDVYIAKFKKALA